MHIETQRLIIRDFTDDDADDLYQILGDSKTMENLEEAYSFARTKDFLDKFCIDHRGAFAAVHKESNKVIGYLLFKPIETDVYEMGWIFNRGYWNKGFAGEACGSLIKYAFEELKIHKILAETIDMVKSVKLMEKLGMQQEGVLRCHRKDRSGVWRDLYLYGLLKEKYLEPEKTACLR